MNLSTDNVIRIGRGLAAIVAALAFAVLVPAQAVTTTTVQGTVYFANGQAASGTVNIQWPSFTTAAGQSIAAGTTTATIGSDGFLTVNLAPNSDASPAGLFYTVTYYLSNGVTNTEYWVVPDAAQATLAQVRASVMPSSQAIQTVSKAYVDQAIANISQTGLSPSGGTLTGPLYLATDPTASLQAADKHYVDSAIAQTVPLSGGTLTGALSGPSIRASVNSQINIMAPPYNAKGDCATDDSAAIQAAYVAAAAANEAVYWPRQPGSCYYVGTPIFTHGASTLGQPAGTNGVGVVVKGAPGIDVFNYPDPTTFTGNPRVQWTMRDITIEPDFSSDVSCSPGGSCNPLYANRYPGKWIGGITITSGSTVLTTNYAGFTCGDIGDNVLIPNGVSTGVALTTTIVSTVAGCNAHSITSVNLATAPTNNISAATVYITPATMPVTQMIGNAGIAMDCADGKNSDWTAAYVSNLHDELINVTITPVGTGGGDHGLYGQNNVAGIYFGACWNPYDFYVRGLRILNFTYGVVQGNFSINPPGSATDTAGVGQDFQHWTQMEINAAWPWISYNDGGMVIDQTQTTARNGFQFLQIGSPTFDAFDGANLNIGEFGANGYTSALSGMRIEGQGNTFTGALMEGSGTIAPLWDASDSFCIRCGTLQGLQINGPRNKLRFTEITGNVVDNSEGNSVTAGYQTSPLHGFETATYAANYLKSVEPVGTQSVDFITDGNMPYFNRRDLFFWPKDMASTGAVPVNDATSPTGSYLPWPSYLTPILNFTNLTGGVHGSATGTILISTPTVEGNLPATGVTLYWAAFCPSITSYTMTFNAQTTTSGGTITSLGTKTVSCSTTYSYNSMTVNLASYGGQYVRLNLSADGVDLAYLGFSPFQASYNGYQPVSDGAGTGSSLEFLESTATPHIYQLRTAAQLLGDLGVAAASSNSLVETSSFTAACSQLYVAKDASVLTATLPSISTGCTISFQNIGGATLTISSGSSNIYQGSTSTVSSVTATTGQTILMWTDGTSWYATKPPASGSTATVAAFSPVEGSTGSGGTGFTANTLNYYVFNLPYNMTISHLVYRLSTADNTSNSYDLGLYSLSGTTATLIADFGAVAGTTFSPTTGVKNLTFAQGSVSLAPGQYVFASTTNCASSCAVLTTGSTSIWTTSDTAGGGSSTGGQLPSSFTINVATSTATVWGFGVY